MGLIERLASRRTTVLVVEVPGWALTRCAVERSMRERGWRPAASPADADLLVVCGRPGVRLTAAIEAVWEQLPGPRARSRVDDVAQVVAALDRTAAALADTAAQRRDAAARPADPPAGGGAQDQLVGDGMAGMDMPMPGGIPLAGEGDVDQLPDPDSLDLDVLHVPLGPVLPRWPAGLVLHTTLQGELLVAAHAEVLGPDGAAADAGALRGTPAGRWDAVATLLGLTGPPGAAAEAARVRDAALAGALPQHSADRLQARLRRSRLLRWSLAGLGELPDGDAHDRLLHWLSGSPEQRASTTEDIAALVVGRDLATARLVVASLDLDTTAPAPARTGSGR